MKTYTVAFIYESFPRFDKIFYKDNLVEFWLGNKLVHVISKEDLAYFRRDTILGLDFISANDEKEAFDMLVKKYNYNILKATIREIDCSEIMR